MTIRLIVIPLPRTSPRSRPIPFFITMRAAKPPMVVRALDAIAVKVLFTVDSIAFSMESCFAFSSSKRCIRKME